jgi:hypothetical protein
LVTVEVELMSIRGTRKPCGVVSRETTLKNAAAHNVATASDLADGLAKTACPAQRSLKLAVRAWTAWLVAIIIALQEDYKTIIFKDYYNKYGKGIQTITTFQGRLDPLSQGSARRVWVWQGLASRPHRLCAADYTQLSRRFG